MIMCQWIFRLGSNFTELLLTEILHFKEVSLKFDILVRTAFYLESDTPAPFFLENFVAEIQFVLTDFKMRFQLSNYFASDKK